MGFRKYTDDYRLENRPGKNGKLKTVPIYHGAYYDFLKPASLLERRKPLLGGLTAAATLMEVLLLCFTTLLPGSFRYAALPMALLLLPLFFVARAVFTLVTEQPPLIREKADRFSKGYPAGAFFLMLLAFVTFGLLVAALIVTGFTVPLFLYTLAALALTGVSIPLFLLRKDLAVEQTKAA